MGKQKVNIPMCAALVLLLLTMLSVRWTCGLYARYATVTEAKDSARVAKFDVVADVAPVAGQEGKFVVTVTNRSEVTVEYSIDVTFTGPMDVTLGSVMQESTDPDTKTTLSFTNSGWKLAPGAEPATHDLLFTVNDWSQITENGSSVNSVTESFNFTVSVHAAQTD